jgi:hypothetical protein
MNIREVSKLGPFAMFDFAVSYLVVIIIYLIGLFAGSWSGAVFVGMILSVIPLSIVVHLIKSGTGPKLNPSTKRTALTDMFLDTRCNFSSITSKIVTIGSVAGIITLALV